MNRKGVKSTGTKIKNARLALGLSQQGLADKAGLHRVTIARIETGAVIPTLKTVITLAHVLGVEVQDLLK